MTDLNPTVPYQPAPGDEMTAEQPQRIGRYRVERVLGQGGFGVVYLAHDDQLQRFVAVKVPHARLVSRPEDAEVYLAEARTVANLDHPNIVPVHDVGSTEDCPCFIVSKFIDGTDLATRLHQSRSSLLEAVDLVATVAEALHYAHERGVVHRDIKPGNLLLDNSGKPFVADFGLALREQDVGQGPCYAGTPAYMSPEQARGEGHRVDGRSDIFNLGVVFYELLTGRRPFRADARGSLLEQIISLEARPPRQWDDTIPNELERICLKALAKRASERYTTAQDLADDLRHFLAVASAGERSTVTGRPQHEGDAATPVPSPVPTPSGPQAITIIPKGLRSFDAEDADFFLELLPGPRDRDGLPDSIRFWKSRIEPVDLERTFPVGLLYGPSGCGKSSLVRAGLLPRLALHVIAVYVEATPEETATQLLKGLRRNCPDLPGNLGLVETLAALRRGRFLPAGNKVLLVLDQFEQWLHAKRQQENTELVQALRQCDGERVQCLVLVRHDFWMAATRFMDSVEVRLVQGENTAAVDLFDLRHAQKVLTAFGWAFGALPEKDLTQDQRTFLDQAVAGLAQDGKIVSVRLALFAEMVKGKPWTPATLKEFGGIEGVGVTFLEETFTASAAPPLHRLHQKAAQAVLKALLPEAGSDIKGHMRSKQELLEASGYGSHPQAFGDLLLILDGELRLVTPTEPEGMDAANKNGLTNAGGQFYQLTHDYLIPSLREWLSRKQKETRRGRAELRLTERAALWNAKPENRHLPAWWEWANILLFTRKRNWTPSQGKMMRKATRYQAVRGLALVLVLLALSATGWVMRNRIVEQSNAQHAAGLVQRLLDAETPQVPGIVAEMQGYRDWTDSLLRDEYRKAQPNSRPQLHASLALLPVDPGQVDYLYRRLLDADPHEVPVIRDALAPHRDALLDKLWAVVASPARGKEPQRLRAATALASYDPSAARWAKVQGRVAQDLVTVPPVYLERWLEALRPIRGKLLEPLSAIYRDRGAHREPSERSLATSILADYAADQPQVLADLLLDADEKQFAVIYPKFEVQGERGQPMLIGEIDKRLSPDAKDGAKETLAKRQANAAVALLRMNQPANVWPLLRHSPDPRVRSYLIHRLAPLGADAGALVKRLDEEPDVTARRALLLSLGEFGEEAWPSGERGALVKKLQDIYRTAPDPGLHAAAEWLLRRWKQGQWLRRQDEAWAKDKKGKEKHLEDIKQALAKKEKAKPQWYVNGQGQTMVVIPGPVDFVMGSPLTEEARSVWESQHRRRIGRTFALATKAVTVEQFLQFRKSHIVREKHAPTKECPVHGVSWYEAAEYCNWLSKNEGIHPSQWCYETNPQGQVSGLKENYLKLAGYRLPTEAEMEYACRAGAATSRYYGESEELLGKYGWYMKSSEDRSWPGGSLKPNDLGLFDMHGNVLCWGQENYVPYPQNQGGKAIEDDVSIQKINNQIPRVLRGGSFYSPASLVRSACRFGNVPADQDIGIGFRPAKTVTAE
jgi:serine/threonine protein kinase/formylglycine-generating enzyme required for sulfatase activity